MKNYPLLFLPCLGAIVALATPSHTSVSPTRKQFSVAATDTMTIRGTVTNERSRPVGNVAVFVTGSGLSTVTNLSGGFEIVGAPVNGSLTFTHKDYEIREFPITKTTNDYRVTMKPLNRQTASASKKAFWTTRRQKDLSQNSDDSPDPEIRLDRWPYFPGGYKALNKYLANNLKYPAEAADAGVQGQVLVSFLLDEEGNISTPRVVKTPGPELDDEAIRVVQSMPRWVPAQKNGKPVAVWYTINIPFDLEVDKLPLTVKEKFPELFRHKITFDLPRKPIFGTSDLKKFFGVSTIGISTGQSYDISGQSYGSRYKNKAVKAKE
jgi:TonB family protein